MVHPFRAADAGRLSPARLLLGFMLCLGLGAGGVLAGISYEQHQLRGDLCGLIVAVQPRSTPERAVGAYGLRIQDGSRTSGQRIGCRLPASIPPPAPSPVPTR